MLDTGEHKGVATTPNVQEEQASSEDEGGALGYVMFYGKTQSEAPTGNTDADVLEPVSIPPEAPFQSEKPNTHVNRASATETLALAGSEPTANAKTAPVPASSVAELDEITPSPGTTNVYSQPESHTHPKTGSETTQAGETHSQPVSIGGGDGFTDVVDIDMTADLTIEDSPVDAYGASNGDGLLHALENVKEDELPQGVLDAVHRKFGPLPSDILFRGVDPYPFPRSEAITALLASIMFPLLIFATVALLSTRGSARESTGFYIVLLMVLLVSAFGMLVALSISLWRMIRLAEMRRTRMASIAADEGVRVLQAVDQSLAQKTNHKECAQQTDVYGSRQWGYNGFYMMPAGILFHDSRESSTWVPRLAIVSVEVVPPVRSVWRWCLTPTSEHAETLAVEYAREDGTTDKRNLPDMCSTCYARVHSWCQAAIAASNV